MRNKVLLGIFENSGEFQLIAVCVFFCPSRKGGIVKSLPFLNSLSLVFPSKWSPKREG